MVSNLPINPLARNVESALPARFKGHHQWWLIALPVLCLAATALKQPFDDTMNSFMPELVPATSTHNRRSSGYSGFFELMDAIGSKEGRLERAYRNLSKLHGTLVMIGPWSSPSLAESKQITCWIDKGNDLVLIDDFVTPTSRILLAGLDVRFTPAIVRKEEIASIEQDLAESKFAQSIKATGEGHLSGAGEPVVSDGHGALLRQVKFGKGRCLIGTIPAMCSNRYLTDKEAKGNFQFLINWLSTSAQPVYFDEKCHGYTSEENALAYLLKEKVGYLVAQIALIFLVALVSLNQRFGQALPEKITRRTSNLEFIEGLALALNRARARDAALAMLFQPFKARLCKALGVSPHESTAQLAAAWSESGGHSPDELRLLLDSVQAALDKRDLSQEELKSLVARLDAVTGKSALIPRFARITMSVGKGDSS